MSTRVTFRRSAFGVAIALTSVAMLTGCLGAKIAIPTNTPAPVVTVTVTPTPVPVPTVTVTSEAAPVEPPPVEEIVPVPEDEPIVLVPPTDNGVIPRATGSVEIDSAGTPYRYTVAAGDVAVEICTRFNRYIWQLTDNNAVTLANPFLLHAGDVILLTANPMPEGYVIPTQ